MSDRMICLPFEKLMQQIFQEHKLKNKVFGVSKTISYDAETKLTRFAGHDLESVLGVAAGPQTQLCQNIVACYYGGARFIETKTVQIICGEDLHVDKPCIRALDEGYNVEWSTELTVEEARDEYIKAWFAIWVMAKELNLGNPNHVQLNMSCGYDLKGIQSKRVDDFLNALSDASNEKCFKECKQWLLDHLDLYPSIDAAYINSIPSRICNTCTLSTMHGCPADEIEKIATYLLVEKGLNTMIKLNPTLMGYDYARNMMDALDYEYITFDHHSFDVDLKFSEAVVMIENLMKKAESLGRFFGVKVSNTMPVKIMDEELPGKEMYMSGKTLYPLTIGVCNELRKVFGKRLQISYSGGADKDNIAEIFSNGIYPITVCTPLLKTGGYDLLEKMAKELQKEIPEVSTQEMVDNIINSSKYHKSPAMKKKMPQQRGYEGTRQIDNLYCKVLCQNCTKVCPNRANEVIVLENGKAILHLDYACNECGNCHFFCVEPCHPYLDRMTYFATAESLIDSGNMGFAYLENDRYLVREHMNQGYQEYSYNDLPASFKPFIDSAKTQFPWFSVKFKSNI